MLVKLNEIFFARNSYTHRYDHLAGVLWYATKNQDNSFTLTYQDIQVNVQSDEIIY